MIVYNSNRIAVAVEYYSVINEITLSTNSPSTNEISEQLSKGMITVH
jgi:hypothetical protein